MTSSPRPNNEPVAVDFWNIVAQYRRIPNGPSVEAWQAPTEMQRRRKTDFSDGFQPPVSHTTRSAPNVPPSKTS